MILEELFPEPRYIAASKELVSFRCYDNSDVVAALTLYEEDRISDLSKPLKDERRGHKNHHVS